MSKTIPSLNFSIKVTLFKPIFLCFGALLFLEGCKTTKESGTKQIPSTLYEQTKAHVAEFFRLPFFVGNERGLYMNFVPNDASPDSPGGPPASSGNWRKETRNHAHEAISMISLAEVGRCAEAKRLIQTFVAHMDPSTKFINYTTRFSGPEREPEDCSDPRATSGCWAGMPILPFISLEVYKRCEDPVFLETMFDGLYENITWWDNKRKFTSGICEGLYFWTNEMETIRDSFEGTGYSPLQTWSSYPLLRQCPADLNFYMTAAFDHLSEIAEIIHSEKHTELAARAEEMKTRLRREFWHPTDQFFYGRGEFDSDDLASKNWVRVKDIGAFMALYAGVANEYQAQVLLDHLSNPQTFGTPFPVTSLSRDRPEWNAYDGHWNGGSWAGPNVLILAGMMKYGKLQAKAHEIAVIWAKEFNRRRSARGKIPIAEWWNALGPDKIKDAEGEPDPYWETRAYWWDKVLCDRMHENPESKFHNVGPQLPLDGALVNCDYITGANVLGMLSITSSMY